MVHTQYEILKAWNFEKKEGACVDIENGVIGRRGDLGNGYQQAEVLNTILMLCRH